MDFAAWIFVIIYWILTESIQAKGSNLIRYRAVRYGSYYSSVYYSYSGGKGYARYSRVYSHANNKYPALYSYMFDWFKTEQFKVYKNSPSGSISVCKNYEADENGTYLGIFTCPLPFVPQDQAYCCGQTNAQYCCTFWDVPTNLAAACIAMAMAVQLLLTVIYVLVQLCRTRIKNNKGKRERIAVRRIGVMCRLGRRVTVGSIWAQALFDKVHAPSNFREHYLTEENEEEEEKEEIYETTNRDKCNFENDTNWLSEKESEQNNQDDVTGVDSSFKYIRCEESATSRTFSGNQSESDNSTKHLFVKDAWQDSKHLEDTDKSFTNKAFLKPVAETENFNDVSHTDHQIKPLRLSPRIKFNSYSEARFSTYQPK